ncbi:acyl-CoA thioesterase [Aliicoccus persicus]|uniref:Acyl-CoA thioester hydrolase n=1 Tax=Aliicoccus persicus TaxID=930138 RepID=A0A662Z3Y0_9STAP|nr:thioesterase family protein [Aliicoccus persicus]SEW07484.1 acyl-CoA thioester hydrolase [Aliicoccus persicus]
MEKGYVAEREIQILYADTDMMGVIYHGNYVKWLELGREQLIEDIGYSYRSMESKGYYAPVYNVDITYKKALKYGDRAFVRTWVAENGKAKVVYGFQIIDQDGVLCTEGTTVHTVVKKVDGEFKTVNFKKAFPEWYEIYEQIKVD